MERCDSCRSVYFVIGTTGSGKSLAAVAVAKTLKLRCGYDNVVVLNCDVMQFYAGLNIATNKVSRTEMEGIPHCFIGFLSPEGRKLRDPSLLFSGDECDEVCGTSDIHDDGMYNIHSFIRDAVNYIEGFFALHSSAAVVVCGGTCYYLQSLLFDNLLTVEDAPSSECCDVVTDVSGLTLCGEGSLWDQLNRIDPDIASRYHPNDHRRVKRLVDIYRRTNRLPSDVYTSRDQPRLRFHQTPCYILWMCVDLQKLQPRLDSRVANMVERGIVDECFRFIKRFGKGVADLPLGKAIGVKEFISSFDLGNETVRIKGPQEVEMSLKLLRANTKRYARQQLQWIKNRFLGRLRQLFATENMEEKFVAIDASVSSSELCLRVKDVVLFFSGGERGIADELYFPLMGAVPPQERVRYEWCDICKIHFAEGSGRLAHTRSKRHRGALKHDALVKDQIEKFGRVIPSKRSRKY